MSKRDLIIKAIWLPIYIILFFGLKYYKQVSVKNPEIISVYDIKEGEFDIFSVDHKICGNIKIQIEANNEIIINLIGEEIQGENIIHKKYKLKPVNYVNFHMKPVTTNLETYYLYDTGESYIILLKIRKKNRYLVENYDKKKNVNLYVIRELSYEKYKYMLEFSNEMELHVNASLSIDQNRYTCFFEQENSREHKKTKSLLRRD